jgi:hypothetical protein
VRVVVRFIKNSPSRLVKFNKIVKENVQTNAFWKLDFCTRWNSTYLRSNIAISYDNVFLQNMKKKIKPILLSYVERKVMEFQLKMIGKCKKDG